MAVTLKTDRSKLVLAPAMGGAVRALTLDGHTILRDGTRATRVLDMAAFPLVPFAGRIDRARFSFDGKEVALRRNFPPEPHAIHGEGWQAPWWIKARGPANAVLEYRSDGTNWPWAFRASQTFALAARSLTLTLAITNEDTSPMPAGLGWHPYFPANGAMLEARTDKIWQAEPGQIAEAPYKPRPMTDLSGPRRVAELAIDNAYDWPAVAGVHTARIAWPGFALLIEASALFDHLVVYTPEGAPYFCVEPLSHTPNAVNSPLPPDLTGLRVLAPGERLEGTITLSVE